MSVLNFRDVKEGQSFKLCNRYGDIHASRINFTYIKIKGFLQLDISQVYYGKSITCFRDHKDGSGLVFFPFNPDAGDYCLVEDAT